MNLTYVIHLMCWNSEPATAILIGWPGEVNLLGWARESVGQDEHMNLPAWAWARKSAGLCK